MYSQAFQAYGSMRDESMAYRELELTLLSARDLKNVNLFMPMDVYAVACINGDPTTRQCTPTDISGGRNPSWNATLRFSVPPSAKAAGGGWLHVLLRCERSLGDRDVGEVVVPLADLLSGADGPGPQPPRMVSYQVHTVQRGEPRGVLNVSYRVGPVAAPVEETAVVGYPPAPQQPPPFKVPIPAPPQQKYQYNGGPDVPPPQPSIPQNIIGGPRVEVNVGYPTRADGSKPVPTDKNAGKSGHSRRKAYYAPDYPDISPPKLAQGKTDDAGRKDMRQGTQVKAPTKPDRSRHQEQALLPQQGMHLRDYGNADSRPKEVYAPTTRQERQDQPAPLQHERFPSFPTAIAR